MTKISIVMPVRNAAASISAALESIFRQSVSEWELIVVDDGSKDETAGLIKQFAQLDPQIRVITQRPVGIAEALRVGCAAARGPFIARMDADDVMYPARLQRQLDFLQTHRELDVVSCKVAYGGHRDRQAGYATHVDWINSLISPDSISLRRFVESPLAHPSVMFRRDLLDRYGSYRAGDFPEDYELWLRWLDAGVRFGKVDAELLTWNDPAERLSRTDPRYSIDAFYRIKCEYLARWLRHNVDSSRSIWLWGAGRITRKRFHSLDQLGVRITGFLDVDPDKAGRHRDGRQVLLPKDLPSIKDSFIIAGVAARGARDLITAALARSNRIEGTDFILAA